jgi:hypothetical protein
MQQQVQVQLQTQNLQKQAEHLQHQQKLQNFTPQVPQHMPVQQMQQMQQMQLDQSQQLQQMQLEQSQQMQQKLLQEEQQLQQQMQQLQRQQEQLQLQMQQLSTQSPAVQQMPQPAPLPQQYVQQTYSPAVSQVSGNVAPEIPTQQMTMPMQQPELARTCSSGSDISSPQPQVQYLMHLPAGGAPTAPQPAPAAQIAPEQPVQYLMHLQPAGPRAMQPPVQQVHMPMPAQMPEPEQVHPDTPQSVSAPQVVPTSSQHVATEPAPAPRGEKEEKKESHPKSAQTEVSSGSTREESVASVADECTSDDEESGSDSDDAMPERPSVPDDLAEALSGLTADPCVVAYTLECLLCLVGQHKVEDFALALYSAAEPELSKTIADLVLRLQPMFPAETREELLGHRVWKLCEEDLPYIASDCPPDRSHGTVVLAADLYVAGALTLAAVKQVFAVLLFSESHPADHAVSLACHAFLRTGPFLDSSEVGMKMVEYLVLRLKEVKGLNLSIATRQSITDVVELQKNRWEPSRMGMTREKTSGQKKARAAARTRARMLITRVQEGVSDPWAGLSNDARALTALLEFAAARDPAAEEALATAPDELIDTLRVVSTPATLPVVLALRH